MMFLSPEPRTGEGVTRSVRQAGGQEVPGIRLTTEGQAPRIVEIASCPLFCTSSLVSFPQSAHLAWRLAAARIPDGCDREL
jgi:hypothetical protein